MDNNKVQQPEYIPLKDFSGNTRLGLMMGTNSLKRQSSNLETCEKSATEKAVSKISAMFPTVTETHIRTLLLKYLKSVFPVAEETIILDTLSSSDNNVHRATQALLTMGFNKKGTVSPQPPPRVCLQRDTPDSSKTEEDKSIMKLRLMEKHPEVAEKVIVMALDSVDFDEAKADKLLTLAVERPKDCQKDSGVGEEAIKTLYIEEPAQACSPESPCIPTESTGRCEDERGGNYKSQRTGLAIGPDPSLRNGPNQGLLLNGRVGRCRPDYVAWTGSAGLAKGPNPHLRQGPSLALGPDPTLSKGSQQALRCK